jgi:quercetin dioxygenase-like cupin family protein
MHKVDQYHKLPETAVAERWEANSHETFAEHYHPHDKTLWCEEGEITFTIDEETLVFKKGQTFVLPAGTRHSAVAGPNGCVCWESPKLDDNPTIEV